MKTIFGPMQFGAIPNGMAVMGEAAWTPTYLIKDEFTTDVAVDNVHNTAAVPGPGTRTVVDTGHQLSISTDRLVCGGPATPAAYGDPGLWYGTLARKAGRAIITSFNISVATQNVRVVNLDSNQSGAGLYYLSFSNSQVGTEQLLVGGGVALTNYKLALVERATGMFYLMKGGVIPEWTLLWVRPDGTDANMYPSTGNYNGAYSCGFLRVADLPAPWNTDYGIATSRLAGARATGDITTSEANGLIEFTWTPAANETMDLMVRRTDDDNCWIVRCNQANSKIYLYEKQTGTETARGTTGGAAQTFTIGTKYRIIARLDANNIKVWVATTAKQEYSSATFNNTATGVKVTGFATGEELIAWPRTLSGAALSYLSQIATDVAPFGYDLDNASASNAAAPLTIPTYDGGNQPIHPDVYDAGAGNTWNEHRYWMAMTPLTGNDATLENPSIVVSEDGNTWAVPTGLTNPVIAYPGAGKYNSDPDLLMVGTTLWMIYRETDGSTYDKIYAVSSEDGVTWSAPALILTTGYTACISPAVVLDGSDYILFSSNNGSMERRTASAITGEWSAPATVLTTAQLGFGVWHINVCIANGFYVATISQSSTGLGIRFTLSTDKGLTWLPVYKNLLTASAAPAWDQVLYRSALVANAAGFDCWYSAYKTAGGYVTKIGRTQILINYRA